MASTLCEEIQVNESAPMQRTEFADGTWRSFPVWLNGAAFTVAHLDLSTCLAPVAGYAVQYLRVQEQPSHSSS